MVCVEEGECFFQTVELWVWQLGWVGATEGLRWGQLTSVLTVGVHSFRVSSQTPPAPRLVNHTKSILKTSVSAFKRSTACNTPNQIKSDFQLRFLLCKMVSFVLLLVVTLLECWVRQVALKIMVRPSRHHYMQQHRNRRERKSGHFCPRNHERKIMSATFSDPVTFA